MGKSKSVAKKSKKKLMDLKPRAPVHADSDDDSSDDGSEDGEGIALDKPISGEKTDVVFEFNDMRAVYNEGITVLLKKMINNPSLAFRLADLTANQVVVGTVIACEGENDVYAFGTIIPIYRKECVDPTVEVTATTQSLMNAPCATHIMTHEIIKSLQSLIKRETPSALMASASNNTSASTIQKEGLPLFLSCLQSTVGVPTEAEPSVLAGLLIHSRMANLPTELIGPLHRNVLQDYQWICQGSNDDSSTDSFDNQQQKVDFMAIKFLVFVSPCTEIDNSASTSDKKSKKQKNSSSADVSSSSVGGSDSAKTSAKAAPYYRNVTYQTTNGIVYDNWEDEVFHEEGVASVLYRNTAIPSISPRNLMVASLVPVEKYKKCVDSLMNMMP